MQKKRAGPAGPDSLFFYAMSVISVLGLKLGLGVDLQVFVGIVGELQSLEFLLVGHHELLILWQTRTGRNQVTADHVLLHALQGIGLGVDGGLVLHLCGTLDLFGLPYTYCL